MVYTAGLKVKLDISGAELGAYIGGGALDTVIIEYNS